MSRKILSLILCAILVFSLVACSREPSDSTDTDGNPSSADAVITVGDLSVDKVEYNYYYYTLVRDFFTNYSQYLSYFGVDPQVSLKEQPCSVSDKEQSWAEFFMDQADETILQVGYFWTEARKANRTLNEESKNASEAFLLSVKEAAEASKQSVDAYLSSVYGEGLTEDLFRQYLERRLLASQYCEELIGAITHTDADYEAYYAEHKQEIDRVSLRMLTVTADFLPAAERDEATEAQAVRALADSFASGLTAENFVQRAVSYAPAADREIYASDSATLIPNQSYSDLSGNETLVSWAFDSGRNAGDVTVLDPGTGAFNVCLFLSRGRMETPLVSMRHILLSVTETEDGKSDDAEKKKEADDLAALWRAGEATEESFAALTAEHSDDPGSAENGGLYADFSYGTMVPAVNDWMFDAKRKPGDMEIVRSEFGYHLIYFVGVGDIAWKHDCREGIENADYDRLIAEYTRKYPSHIAEGYREKIGNQI